jgi:outer membrane protein assembly factor BamB
MPDLHEFLVTPDGHAYVIAASPVSLRGLSRPLIDSVVLEIDIKTGLVLFEWHALDHVGLDESYKYTADVPGHVVDPYHLNSISVDRDGNLIVSMRNTSAIYKLDHRTGQIIWRLGGKNSSFEMGPGTATGFQHNVVVHRDGTLTVFDNGAGPPQVHPDSRGIRIALDTTHMTATLVSAYSHSPTVSSNFEGGVQKLAGGETLLGYGQKPYFTEFDAAGQEDLDARFTTSNSSYRAYRFRWRARPSTPPAVSVARSGRRLIVYASWNGATGVARWRVLGGASRSALRPVGEARKRGFETSVTIGARRYVAVQALGAKGHVLASTAPVRAR